MDNPIGQIYTGPWINFSRGRVLGSTLTLSTRNGSLLTSFLAAFITVVASQLWHILSFTIHQLRSSAHDQDGLYHQHQVIFRNTTSPISAARIFLWQCWAWRRRTESPFSRSISWFLFSIFYTIIFAVLSVFSAEVSKAAGDQRLVLPGNCGFWDLDNSGVNPTTNSAYARKTLNDSSTAANYARECYGSAVNNLECSTLLKPSLAYTADMNASCPFAPGMCDTDAVTFDTGFLDSRDDLGINTPSSGQVQFRKINTCAPVTSKGFLTITNATNTNSEFFSFNYGPMVNITDYTFRYNNAGVVGNIGYTLTVLSSFTGVDDNAWTPIPKLNRTDADVSLMFISPNSIMYDTPNTDPIFAATIVADSVRLTPTQNITFYTGNYWVSVLGCVEQYQLCNPSTNYCTPLSGFNSLLRNSINNSKIAFNELQDGSILRITNVATFTNFLTTISPRGGYALLAQETVNNLRQGPLPSNQWQIEVQGWFDVALAMVQRLIVEYATGPAYVPEGSHIWQPNDTVSRGMCHSQLVSYADNTVSFSTLGIAIILVLGSLIIIISLIIEPVTDILARSGSEETSIRYTNWVLDDKLQLQRVMFESNGLGGEWQGESDSVPTTTKLGIKFSRSMFMMESGDASDDKPDRASLLEQP